LLVKYVLAYYSLIECPRCNNKMKEISYRRFKYNCGYENDCDVIAIKNLNGVVLLATYCPPNAICSSE